MRTICLLLIAAMLPGCSSSPTAPDGRTGYIGLRAVCDDTGPAQMICVAQTYCAGGYRCPDPRADNADVTARAEWTVAHPAIVRQGAQPNWFLAAGPGDTVVRVRDASIQQETIVRVSVFPGVPSPLLTTEVWGRVTEAGTAPAAGIRGAVTELSGALIGTRTAVSGGTPALLPGYVFVLGGDNGFQFFGIPRGTYQLSVRAEGFVPQTQTLTITAPGSPMVNFQLVRGPAGSP
jgi:hypothetical protein